MSSCDLCSAYTEDSRIVFRNQDAASDGEYFGIMDWKEGDAGPSAKNSGTGTAG